MNRAVAMRSATELARAMHGAVALAVAMRSATATAWAWRTFDAIKKSNAFFCSWC
jgi:hypothetical protein